MPKHNQLKMAINGFKFFDQRHTIIMPKGIIYYIPINFYKIKSFSIEQFHF